MQLLPRFILGTAAAAICVAMSNAPALAVTKAKPLPANPGPARPAALPPLVFQVNPTRVHPGLQPNIIITGQHLSAATTVAVGGRAATTIEAPDPQTLLVKLPTDLGNGSYSVAVTNEAGTAVASDRLIVDDSGSGPSNLTKMAGAGCLLLLLVLMRLARTPGFA